MASRHLPNWIKGYLAYTAESESPEEYHQWVALSTISGAMRRRSFFAMGYFLLYPNLYVVLVGPPGRCKKSTAMRIGRSLLSKVPEVQFTTDSVTRERLIQDLSQSHVDGHSSMTAFSSEFASLLTSSGMDMVVFLTDIYESPDQWSHKTKIGGINLIKAPYLNLLGATTPDWIARSLPLDTVGIGLTSRVVFVYQDTPRVRPAFPVLSPEQVELGKLLEHDLRIISTINGEFTLTPDAKSAYEEWYQGRLLHPNPTNDGRLAGYYERKPMHVLKICMLISASKKQETVITLEDYTDTQTILSNVEDRMPQVFAAVGKNPLAYDTAQVLAVIKEAGPEGVPFAVLLNMFKHSVRKEELAECTETLTLIGQVRTQQTPTGPVYYPK